MGDNTNRKLRIYVVRGPSYAPKRLVRATSKSAAVATVTAPYEATLASQEEIAALVAGGATIEGARPAPVVAPAEPAGATA